MFVLGFIEAVFFVNLLETLLVEFADGSHFDLVGEAVDGGVVGALAAATGADKSRFQHLRPASGR